MPCAKPARNSSSARGSASASVKASGSAPQAARSLRLTASALWPSRAGGTVERKWRPSTSMSHDTASCMPAPDCSSAQSSPTPSAARRTGRVKWRAMSSNSPAMRHTRYHPSAPFQPRLHSPEFRLFPAPRGSTRAASNQETNPMPNTADDTKEQQAAELKRAALEYHEFPTPGKLAVQATKQMTNQRDLALAYSPGVAAACEEIVADPANAFRYTARGNLVAVVTNGTAVLGLGNIGPLAAKPVMEGKAVLFKKFAGIDVFDLEIDEPDLDKLVDVIAALEPTFGGINLEDIKAPDCFYVERRLRERMKIPVFHDDQHGTAIVVGAALLNALTVVGKPIAEVKLVTSGAGAAALACLGLLVKLGVKRENIWVTDLAGVVYAGPHRADGRGQGGLRPAHGPAHAGRGARRRRHLPGPFRRRRAQAGHGERDGPAADHLRAGQPHARDRARNWRWRRAPTPSSPPAAPTTRTRSTTSCVSRTSSAARWTAAPPR